MQMSMVPPRCKRSSQYFILQVERDVMQVHHMCYSWRSKDRKVFEYLVDELSTWVTKDQLRISLSSTLLSELRGKYLIKENPNLEELEEYVANRTCLK